jgi:FXSXX-COOH protein
VTERTAARGRDGDALPDYRGVDLSALRARVDHPVLGSVLASLLARSREPDRGAVAYHEDSPTVGGRTAYHEDSRRVEP